jgi:hypothetical protein
MKNIVILISISCILFSCQKPKDEGVNMLNHLSVNNVEKFIPLESYESFSKVIFVNQSGEEKILNVNVERGQEEKEIENILYSSDILTIHLTDETNSEYSIFIRAIAEYWDFETTFEYVSSFLYSQHDQGFYIPDIRIASDGQPLVCILEQEKILLNKTFVDVYTNYQVPETHPYSTIFYNIEFGIIGFKDYDNALWVFERYE